MCGGLLKLNPRGTPQVFLLRIGDRLIEGIAGLRGVVAYFNISPSVSPPNPCG
jgi:hypothetical protein